MKCPYCSATTHGRCATASGGRSITECTSCGRVVEERHHFNHHLFHLRAQDNPLFLVTSDLASLPLPPQQTLSTSSEADEDPFEPTGFITAFSTFSLENTPLSLRSTLSFSGYLAELERTLESTNPSSSSSSSSSSASASNSMSSSTVVVDNLRAYMQIIDVASILGLDCDISDHAFQLFRDCCSATCLRNRSVEALATAALVQAIREAQEPRTLQEISLAANVPQKEIGKYIKILGEALQLSQPINSNSISVHMPRFCTLLQLNKSAQELATHIGEVVINKCFCTRRNPISISAAAIYLACQLEDKRKTQAEICKVTGLTEVTLRKVYKELLESLDDLLPSNYTPAVPPEKAFPTTAITSGRTSAMKAEVNEVIILDKDSQAETKPNKDKKVEIKSNKLNEVSDTKLRPRGEESECKGNSGTTDVSMSKQMPTLPWLSFGPSGAKSVGDKNQSCGSVVDFKELASPHQPSEKKDDKDPMVSLGSIRSNQISTSSAAPSSVTWPIFATPSWSSVSAQYREHSDTLPDYADMKGVEFQNRIRNAKE